MNITPIYTRKHGTENTIVTAALSAPDEYVMLLSSGDVIRQKMNASEGECLFSVQSSLGYRDGGFDINAPSTIYTLDDIVVVVNDYKTHGYVHYPGKYPALHLWRNDYYASISRYPVTLFRDPQHIPYIIYSTAWNCVHIMNLDTRQVVTAAKSLIEELAEERHLEFYKTHEERNKLPWPSSHDYFYGELRMSPDGSKFLSAGWGWGSCDLYHIYDIAHFISSNRIAHKRINGWEHNNRGVCWVDDNTVAVTYHPYSDEEDDAIKEGPGEIHFYNVAGSTPEIIKKIKLADVSILNTNLHYNKQLQAFIAFSDTLGVMVFSPEGSIFFHDPSLKISGYNAAANLLIQIDGNTLTVCHIG